MGALYRLDFPSGKSYIGITAGEVSRRFTQHVSSSLAPKQAVHKAIAKYTPEAVRVTTLALANDWAYLCLLEKKAIATFETFSREKGYNLTKGGDGFKGFHTPEAKAKISAASRNCSEATRAKLSAAGKGRSNAGTKHSAEARREKSTRQLSRKVLSAKNTSGYTGVYWSKAAEKWQAHYKLHGKVHYLGLFDDKDEAARVRSAAVLAALGDSR